MMQCSDDATGPEGALNTPSDVLQKRLCYLLEPQFINSLLLICSKSLLCTCTATSLFMEDYVHLQHH